MREKALSKEQILSAIRRSILHEGMPPTVEELRKALKVGSTRTVLRYLRWLEDEGELERWSGARGLRLVKAGNQHAQTSAVPLVGEAPAGALMVAEQNIEGWVRLPKEYLKPARTNFFLLRVRGDSMNKAMVNEQCIESGDLLLVRQQSAARSGDVVVALIDGEATIKRLVQGEGYFLLKPESTNPNHKPIILNRDFQVQGIVSKVLKKGSELLSYLELAQAE
jgi:repressor LexA